MIDKDDLDLSMTLSLSKDAVLGDVDYIDDLKETENKGESTNSMLPFWMLIFKKEASLDIDKLIKEHTASMDMDDEHIVFTTSDPELYNNYLAYTLDAEIYKDNNKKDTAELIISAAKPYLIMELNAEEEQLVLFKRVEQKEFSFDDYAGYSIEEWTPSKNEKK